MLTKLLLALGISGAVVVARKPVGPRAPLARATNTCAMKSVQVQAEALLRIQRVVEDTSVYFTSLRTRAGLLSATLGDIETVSDTLECQRALRAFWSFYDSTSEATVMRSVDSGLLVRVGPNRRIWVVDVFNQWSGATYTVFDSTYSVVRPNL